MPTLPELKAVHAEMLDLLKIFDGLCRAYGVRYTLSGGTLLGAMREKGFIPWDDDLDVALTRAEYEKLRSGLLADRLTEHVTFSEFSAQHPRIWLRRPNRPGAWIDVFIFDYISERPAAARMKLLGCAFFLAFTKNKESMELTRKVGKYSGLKAKLLNLGYYLGKPFSPRVKARMQNWYCKRAFPGRRTRIHRSNDGYSYISIILPASTMAGYVYVPFEDTEMMVTTGWREMLVSSYGEDFMTPKRAASHKNKAHEGYIGVGAE